MAKMKTAIFTGPKKIEIQEVDLPPLGERQVLVKVKKLCTLYVGATFLYWFTTRRLPISRWT